MSAYLLIFIPLPFPLQQSKFLFPTRIFCMFLDRSHFFLLNVALLGGRGFGLLL